MTPRAFVWATLTTFFALLAAVLSLNVAVDPFALAGTNLVSTCRRERSRESS